jgi:ATP-binding protein involved in chromosome partitioning
VLEKVKYIVAVASGKGGVGKSTTAVNTALALHSMGKSVGLLDADIYGPSIGMMLDVPEDQRPDVVDEKFFKPVMAKGLATMSMAYLTTDKTPMVWRGPMAAGALQQMLQQTQWGELDVLVIDMPPGTGDIQLTLSQKAQISGAIIVTTPQDIALLDAKKGIEMFLKVKIPVIGIIENMATHICSQCGVEEAIFGDGGGEEVAQQYQTRLLGSLPLDRTIREQCDSGNSAFLAETKPEIAAAYTKIAQQLWAELDQSAPDSTPEIVFE